MPSRSSAGRHSARRGTLRQRPPHRRPSGDPARCRRRRRRSHPRRLRTGLRSTPVHPASSASPRPHGSRPRLAPNQGRQARRFDGREGSQSRALRGSPAGAGGRAHPSRIHVRTGRPATPTSSTNNDPPRSSALSTSGRALVTRRRSSRGPPKAQLDGRAAGIATARSRRPSGAYRRTSRPSQAAIQRWSSASTARPSGRPSRTSQLTNTEPGPSAPVAWSTGYRKTFRRRESAR